MDHAFHATVRDQYGTVHWSGTVDAYDEAHARERALEYADDDLRDVYADEPHKALGIEYNCRLTADAHRIPRRTAR